MRLTENANLVTIAHSALLYVGATHTHTHARIRIYVRSWALNEHLCPMRKHKRLKYMQALMGSSLTPAPYEKGALTGS